MSQLQLVSKSRCFGGWVEFYSHPSSSTKTEMKFSVYRPPAAENKPVPVLYWLSGLTCSEENFMAKAGAQRLLSELGIMVVCPDTSPRNTGIAGEAESWDFGTAAGFYVDATQAPWNAHFKMYSYVTDELPGLIAANFPVDANRQSVFGHSMGGHGALVIALRNPGRFRSVSAFAPISAPSQCPWGEKAFSRYLGADRQAWENYDASNLLARTQEKLPILVHQGTADKFLNDQLMPEKLEQAAKASGHPLELVRAEGYDHSYYFISSFIAEHLKFHAGHLW